VILKLKRFWTKKTETLTEMILGTETETELKRFPVKKTET